MKKVLVGLLVVMMAWCSVSYAGPAWISDENFALLENLEGFDFNYDDFDDWFGVFPSDSAGILSANDVAFFPRLYGASDGIEFAIRMKAIEKGTESITSISFSVDGVRYDHEVPLTAQTDLYDLFIGKAGLGLVKSIIDSKEKVKVRLYYSSGNVDFDVTDSQIALLRTIYDAYESVGGLEQNDMLDYVDFVLPITIK